MVLEDPAISACGLVKRYGSGVLALDGMSLTVQKGTIFALLGPNGAGKTTTVKIFTSLTHADEGEARVLGMDTWQDSERVRQSIGCVAQRSWVDDQATGRANLSLQGQLYGLHGPALGERVSELIEQLGLSEFADRMAHAYSGGMRRRLDIAMGVVHRPQVLFLDEPTAGLDPEGRSDIWNLVHAMIHDEDLTVLLTTHYMEEADQLADQVAIVDRGHVVVTGTPEQLKRELRGDALRLELSGDTELDVVLSALKEEVGVSGVTVDGRILSARVEQSATAAPAILTALHVRGIPVVSLSIARPSLDDVYLRYAGRRLFEGDEEHGSPSGVAGAHGASRVRG